MFHRVGSNPASSEPTLPSPFFFFFSEVVQEQPAKLWQPTLQSFFCTLFLTFSLILYKESRTELLMYVPLRHRVSLPPLMLKVDLAGISNFHCSSWLSMFMPSSLLLVLPHSNGGGAGNLTCGRDHYHLVASTRHGHHDGTPPGNNRKDLIPENRFFVWTPRRQICPDGI